MTDQQASATSGPSVDQRPESSAPFNEDELTTIDLAEDVEYITHVDPKEVKPTKMRAIALVAVTFTLSCTTMQSVAQSGYLYLMMIDKNIPPIVFFFSYGAAKISQFTILIITSLYTNRTQRYRWPLIMGRVYALLGVLLYLSLRLVDPEWRVTVYITAFVFIGCGEGTLVICRGYAPKYSSIEKRSAALGIMTAAGLAGILFGPAVNLSFAPLKETTLSYWGGISWNIFTLPLLILIGLNLLAIILAFFVEEPTHLRSYSHSGLLFELPPIRSIVSEEKQVVNTSLWCLSLQLKACTAGSFFAVLTGLSQHFDATFNLTKAANIELLSKCQIGAGLVSAAVSVAFIFGRLGTRRLFHPTLTLVYSLMLFASMALITVDWPWADNIVVKDALSATGCNPEKFGWCFDTKQIDRTTWILIGGALLGLSMPLSLISQDTLFSRVIEKSTRTDLHQGVYAAVECLVLTIVPPISGPAYVRLGPHWFYSCIGLFQVLIFLRFAPYIAQYKKMTDANETNATDQNPPKEEKWELHSLSSLQAFIARH